jgi:2-keto-3-deoxy-L-fuconate dehydrogenase
MFNNDFKDLVAIVTGGASGIGESTARLIQSRGGKVFVFDKNKPITPINNVTYVLCDITNKDSVNKSVAEIGKSGLDILINNAGIGVTGDVVQATDAEWHKVLDVNIVGTARMSAAAIPYLINSKYASIVNVSSTASINGFSELAVYSASKGAINSLTLAMAADCLRKGIRVNCVVPATTDTPWIDRFVQNSKDPQQFKKEIISVQPMQRLVTAYEVASAICYLASPVSASTHGTILNVDGGVTGVRF